MGIDAFVQFAHEFAWRHSYGPQSFCHQSVCRHRVQLNGQTTCLPMVIAMFDTLRDDGIRATYKHIVGTADRKCRVELPYKHCFICWMGEAIKLC